MIGISFFILLISVGVAVSTNYNETLQVPRPLRDRFRIIQSNVDEQRVSDEIEDLTAYGCEKIVVIRNKAQESFKISCQSYHDSAKETVIEPGKAYVFTFRPLKNGNSKYWCNLEYKQAFVRFDVYNEDLTYMCSRDVDEVYQYVVRDEGIFVDKSKGIQGQKIRALMEGHNKFVLWEEFENGEIDGYLLSGLVDGGMCYDIPDQFNDLAAAVTICYNHCVRLYEHYGCQGKMQLVQAVDDCRNTAIFEDLGKKLSSIQGC